jgi:hypothetical protein
MRRLLIHHARPLHRQAEQVELSEDLDLEAKRWAFAYKWLEY